MRWWPQWSSLTQRLVDDTVVLPDPMDLREALQVDRLALTVHQVVLQDLTDLLEDLVVRLDRFVALNAAVAAADQVVPAATTQAAEALVAHQAVLPATTTISI